ncbi:MAG: glycosyltransferase family 39 protein [Candidatus Micrarchaeota archaeon]
MKPDWHLRALIVIFLAAFLLKAGLSSREYLVHNIDAGYYVKNMEDVLSTGFPSVSDPPLAFYYGAAFAFIFGTMAGFKVAISLASAAIAFPAYKVAELLSGRKDAAILAAFLAAFSGTNMFMMGDLLKNMLGLFFGAWFLYFALKAGEKFSLRDAALCAFAAILMVASHFSSAGYIFLTAAPYFVLRPYLRRVDGPSRENLFCAALLLALLLGALGIIILRGWDLSRGIGVLEFSGRWEPNAGFISEYGIFLFPALLGLRSSEKRWLFLIPYLAVTLLMTQQLFVREDYTMRFEWNAYFMVAVLAGIGTSCLRDDRAAHIAAAALLCALVLLSFFRAADDTHPIIYEEEWQGLLRLREEMPWLSFRGIFGGTEYWAEAAGFVVSPDGTHVLACDSSIPAPNRWLAAGCEQAVRMAPEEIRTYEARGKVAARFGRFAVIEAGPQEIKR